MKRGVARNLQRSYLCVCDTVTGVRLHPISGPPAAETISDEKERKCIPF